MHNHALVRPLRHRGRWTAAIGALVIVAGIAAVQPAVHARADAGWSTRGNQILDPNGAAFRITGVNWYGFETTSDVAGGLGTQSYRDILDRIRSLGYNTVRLPFSDQLVREDPTPDGISRAANPDLVGLPALQVMDKIIDYAGQDGLTVILDNHRSEAGDSAEANGLWYGGGFTSEQWVSDWTTMARRYADIPAVIGFDLRNEPHSTGAYGQGGATWGSGDPATDWQLAAQTAGNAVLGVAPSKLVFVEGVGEYPGAPGTWWGGNLRPVADHPVTLDVSGKLVYSAHEYGPAEYQQPYFNGASTQSLQEHFTTYWGYLSQQNIAPVWVSEFGTPNDDASVTDNGSGSQGQWFGALTSYLGENSAIGWTYWALNGEDRYGLLNGNYDGVANAAKQQILASLQAPDSSPVETPAPAPTTPPSATPAPATSTPPVTAPPASTPPASTPPASTPPAAAAPVAQLPGGPPSSSATDGPCSAPRIIGDLVSDQQRINAYVQCENSVEQQILEHGGDDLSAALNAAVARAQQTVVRAQQRQQQLLAG